MIKMVVGRLAVLVRTLLGCLFVAVVVDRTALVVDYTVVPVVAVVERIQVVAVAAGHKSVPAVPVVDHTAVVVLAALPT